MNSEDIETSTAEGDAIIEGGYNSTIVRCGLEKTSSEDKVATIDEDIDLLVLWIVLAPPQTNFILLIKLGRRKKETKTYFSLAEA